VSAQKLPEAGKKARFSLLTASPGTKVWSHYGHTGIRYNDPDDGLDIVFNYGLFDFSSPNFIGRFVTGQTDYLVGTSSYFDFLLEYRLENRAVTEQVLNLTQQEKTRLWQALLTNIHPENRVYRYNFFYKNCATLPRDIIEQSINGQVEYTRKPDYNSLREVIHHFTNDYPWIQYGIDFALGAEADREANLRIQQFAPDILMHSFSTAIIRSDTAGIRPLVLEYSQPVTIDPELKEKGFPWPGPLTVMWTVFGLTGLLTILEIIKKRQYHLLDAVLFTVAGILGCLMLFLMLFSEHPATDENYLSLWIHPFHLLFVIGLIIPAFRRKGAALYKTVNLPLQLFALAGVLFLPQTLHPAAYPLLLTLMLRSLSGSWFLFNKLKHE